MGVGVGLPVGNLEVLGLLRGTALSLRGKHTHTCGSQLRTWLEWTVTDSVSQHKCRLGADSLTSVLSNLRSKRYSSRENFQIKPTGEEEKPPRSHPLHFPAPWAVGDISHSLRFSFDTFKAVIWGERKGFCKCAASAHALLVLPPFVLTVML